RDLATSADEQTDTAPEAEPRPSTTHRASPSTAAGRSQSRPSASSPPPAPAATPQPADPASACAVDSVASPCDPLVETCSTRGCCTDRLKPSRLFAPARRKPRRESVARVRWQLRGALLRGDRRSKLPLRARETRSSDADV